ncbi:MAG: AAA family ATPase, partial [Candidatus Nanohaloarchaea archaeon]|nr:AAA family ATPase [Candidatus Nanohaloarchaea archaeon]
SPLILIPVTVTEENLGEPDRHDYEITLAGIEPKVNPALRKKLLADFNIELPEDEHIDLDELQETLEAIEEAIGGKPAWDVTDKLVLGIFDFSKYPLYKDLERNRRALHENHLIQAMNEGNPDLIDRPAGEIPDAEELDEKVTPQETFQVLNADSSQQRAIEAAKAGQSFVLQGPPGTGKSQTIANIIAEKLADNETILFVSEKQAALNVVKDRLDDVGLGKFCLEAHGKKAGKKDVLDQIARERDRRTMPSPEERERDLDRLKEVRDELNRFGDLLQSVPGEMEKTVFEVEGILSDLDSAPRVQGEFTDPLNVDDATFRDAVDALKPLQNHPEQIKAYSDSPWRYLTAESWGFDMREKFQHSIQEQKQVLEEVRDVSERLKDRWGLDVDSISELRDAESFLDHAVQNPMPRAEPPQFVSGFEQHNKDMEELANMSLDHVEKKEAVREDYQESIFDIDAKEYREDIEAFGLSRIIRPGYWNLRSDVLDHARDEYSPGKEELLEDLETLEEIEELEDEIEEFEWLQEKLGSIYQGEETDWETIKDFWSWLKQLKQMNDATEKLKTLGTDDGRDDAEDCLEETRSVLEEFEQAVSFFDEIFDLDEFTYNGTSFDELSLQAMEELLEELRATSDTFRDWVDFTRLADQARDTLA